MKNHLSKKTRRLLDSDFVTAETRRVLRERLNAREMPPRFFGASEFEILKAVCAALAPSQSVPNSFAAGEIDKRLTENSGGNGWRYDSMPTDGESYKIGLRFLNESARENFQNDFARLEIEERKSILKRCSSGDDEQTAQPNFSPARFLEEIGAEFAETFYSHPFAQAEVGCIGFADARGWDVGVQSPKSEVQSQINESETPKLKTQNPKSSEVVDAVIIGAGAGGAPVLARLAQAGLKVVALEAGKSFN